ncbi:MAG TPA: hypothetical protein PK691_09205, partial [Thermomicrobiales bacterium]|nr:hypothetical protein [Thermomicrobiales bacterium]
FHTNPPIGNYLKTHWNVASSEFLGRPVPKVTLDKTSSKFNGVVKVSLVRFAPNVYINLKWADGTKLASVKAKADGTATTSFRTPLVPLGNYTVTASNSSGDIATTTLRVIPRILLNETKGEAGMSIRVYFYGFAPDDKVEVRFWNTAGTSSQLLTTITIANNGRGTKVVNVPTKTTVGKHKIVGKVFGVGRSASTTFTVTSMGTAEEPTATATSTLSPTVTVTSTIEPTITPGVESTVTPDVVTETPPSEIPTEIASPEVPTETPEGDAPTDTATPELLTETPVPEATSVPLESPTQVPTETPVP